MANKERKKNENDKKNVRARGGFNQTVRKKKTCVSFVILDLLKIEESVKGKNEFEIYI